ncbi:MAG: ankyrin repeat domain-containing protein [Verrucomicrobia bacterium]|nr:ankyrin repeat domain-containing protein [Verrucomicrobiota bacterium]
MQTFSTSTEVSLNRFNPNIAMSDVKISCPGCQQHLELSEEHLGQMIQCPSCSADITMPFIDSEATAVAQLPAAPEPEPVATAAASVDPKPAPEKRKPVVPLWMKIVLPIVIITSIIRISTGPWFFVYKDIIGAISYSDKAAVLKMLDNGADIRMTDEDGDTAMHVVSEKSLALLLINKGADINTTNIYGNTPLHQAVTFGNKEIAILLIEKGANLNIKNIHGSTALDVSLTMPEVAEMIIDRGGR